MTDSQKYLQEFIKETIKEMVDDGEILLVRDETGNIGIGYERAVPEQIILKTSSHNDLDEREGLRSWGILSKNY